jgi:peptidylprolyl isomerase
VGDQYRLANAICSSPYQGEARWGCNALRLAPSAQSPYMRTTHSIKTQKVSPMADYADPENTLVIETTKGNVVIALRPDLAPNHVAHIKKLAREKFYDGVVFHRVIEGFMAQTGDPRGTGTGGSKYPDLKQEFNAEPHVRGTASMARSSNPDSANSQFFICFADAPFLNKQYTVWGQVIEGMENVDQIKRGEPVINPDKMVTVRVAADLTE